MGTDQLIEEPVPHRRGRLRKKQLHNSIRQQMEFYFSDSNLDKDRFLGNLLRENDYVAVDVFLNFNKIRKLTSSLSDIVKSIKKSELLELSEDETKVKRIKPVETKANIDDCTIYVQHLKSDTTHEWLKNVFSDFGNVVYVSLPKYSHNKQLNKGFAFIEFELEQEAQKAVEFFESIDCKISSQMSPEELSSIATFDGNKDKVEKPKTCDNKRKLDDEDDVKPDVKKFKVEDDDSASEKPQESDVEKSAEADDKKKIKKINKKKAQMKELGLQVLLKVEWKKMRNRYLNMQRAKMKQLKQHLRKHFQNKYEDKPKTPESKTEMAYEQCAANGDAANDDENSEYASGLIVKMTFAEPCSDLKKMRNEIKIAYPDLEYVDIPITLNSDEGFLRFSNSDSAKAFCAKHAKGQSEVLEGADEKLYWEKIKAIREAKCKKEKKKQRGRDKLLKKAERELGKHIRFDGTD